LEIELFPVDASVPDELFTLARKQKFLVHVDNSLAIEDRSGHNGVHLIAMPKATRTVATKYGKVSAFKRRGLN
jgi:hypothetical protein